MPNARWRLYAERSHLQPKDRLMAKLTESVVEEATLEALGVHAYLRGKELALFVWRPAAMPDPAGLRCTSMVALPGGGAMPELDRFGVFAWSAGLALVGRNLARVLGVVGGRVLG